MVGLSKKSDVTTSNMQALLIEIGLDTYIEPGTGKRFRSLISVKRYIAERKLHAATLKPHQMAILPCNFKRNPSFRLPSGWDVEEKPRNNINYAGTVDRTYIEPGTGKRFRSLISVERYIAEGKLRAATLKPHQLYLTDGKQLTTMAGASSPGDHSMAILPCNFKRNSSFRLPSGWDVEEKPRNNINYAGTVDRTYIEPGTRKRFRSLISVERHIAEGNLHAATPKPHHLYLTDGKQPTTMAGASSLGDHSMEILPCNFKRNSSFRLPSGWDVEEKPRNNINYAGTVDKTYIEPRMAKRFRSLISVERHIAEGKLHAATPKPHQLYLTDEKQRTTMAGASSLEDHSMAILPCNFRRSPSFRMPSRWDVEEKPPNNISYAGTVDRTYIEPGTGKRFRSLISVERHTGEGSRRAATPKPHQLYLTDGKQHTTMAKASTPGDHSPSSSFGCEKASTIRPRKPPANVKWVLSPVGSIWKPFINDSLVPESLKRKWSQAFVHTLYNGL
ncbi:methyl-CpG-binding domain-containing protein 7 isoform X3 [Euphorbia lathyris]|uniref:methyl-CpG-binding domain-containing protein 7 isoform X3 n=1 Tax=Euphorbia lathyris TaxID=212925 RepID=UPI0033144E50